MSEEEFGFIILRNVNNEEQDNIWIECYNCIRKLYDNKIVIIDDNSNYNMISKVNLINVEIIDSEFKGRGELLPYYYLLEKEFFKKAIILHDSMFIQKKLNLEFNDVKFLWHVHTHKKDNFGEIIKLINSLYFRKINKVKKLLKRKKDWLTCFGAASIIELDFLKKIELNYKIKGLVKVIKTRVNRMAFERIIALLSFICSKTLNRNNLSLFDSILIYGKEPFHYSYSNYIQDKNDNKLNLPIYKIWVGREQIVK